jgi:hypothetical protein
MLVRAYTVIDWQKARDTFTLSDIGDRLNSSFKCCTFPKRSLLNFRIKFISKREAKIESPKQIFLVSLF